MAIDTVARRIIQRGRPTAGTEGNNLTVGERSSPYGDMHVIDIGSSRPDLADEGSYYVATNATTDTAVACGVIAAYASTTPLFLIANTELAGGRTIRLDHLRMFRFTVAPASGTSTLFSVEVDTTTRLSTAPTGGAIATVNNVNPGKNNDFGGTVYGFTGGTVLTVMAASSKRVVTRGMLSHSIPVVLDEQILTFGQGGHPATALAAGVGKRVASAGPVIIPPQCSAAIHVYYPSNAITGASFEWELAMSQR